MVIYLITNTINGKVYVGRTKQTAACRMKTHLALSRKGDKGSPLLYRAIRKHGEDAFTLTTLCSCDSLEQLNRMEQIFIMALRSTHRDRGYNLVDGGEGCLGLPKSEAFKQFMSERMKGNTYGLNPSDENRRKMASSFKGKHHTDEHKAYMSKRLTGRIISDETKQRCGEWQKGRILPPETRAKQSAASKAMWADPVRRQQILDARKKARQ
jgi:group I intron endonuclease